MGAARSGEWLSLLAAATMAFSDHAARADESSPTAPPPPATPPEPATMECSSSHEIDHLLGVVFDAGQGAASYGARYLNAYRDASGCGGLGSMMWAGLGADVRGYAASALEGQAVGRVGFMADTGGFAIELGAGGATTFGTGLGTGSAAFLFDFFFFGLGAAYHFPIAAARPGWMGEWDFALRVHVPLGAYDKEEKQWKVPRPR